MDKTQTHSPEVTKYDNTHAVVISQLRGMKAFRGSDSLEKTSLFNQPGLLGVVKNASCDRAWIALLTSRKSYRVHNALFRTELNIAPEQLSFAIRKDILLGPTFA